MPTRVINKQPLSVKEYLLAMRRQAGLINMLALRELKVKYSRTVFGIGWFFLQPALVVLVYSFFFKYLIHIHSDGVPYPPFVFSGLVLWYLFTGIIGRSTFALIESAQLIHQASFPRLILLLSKTLPVALECFILLVLLFALMPFNGYSPGFNLLGALYYFTTVFIFSLGLGIFCSVLALRFRDLAHSIPFVINFGIWLTPVFYPATLIPAPYITLIRIINPLFSSIEGLRAVLFSASGISLFHFMVFIFSCLLLLAALYYFIKFEKRISENS